MQRILGVFTTSGLSHEMCLLSSQTLEKREGRGGFILRMSHK